MNSYGKSFYISHLRICLICMYVHDNSTLHLVFNRPLHILHILSLLTQTCWRLPEFLSRWASISSQEYHQFGQCHSWNTASADSHSSESMIASHHFSIVYNVRMYVHVRTFICILYIQKCTYIIRTYVPIHVHTCTHNMPLTMYVHVHTSICMYIHMYVQFIWIHTHAQICMLFIRMHVHMYVCIQLYAYVHVL